MNKSEYLNILSARLKVLQKDEYDNIMEYYTEYFEDAGVEKEFEVIDELGDPNLLADKILRENGFSYDGNTERKSEVYENGRNKNRSNGIKIVLLIIFSPVIFAIMCAAGAMVIGFGAAALALLISGIGLFIVGIGIMFTSILTGLFITGSGLVVFALGCLFALATGGILHLGVFLVKKLVLSFNDKRQYSY